MLGNDDVPRLLTTQAVITSIQVREHIAVADLRRSDLNTLLFHRKLEAKVRHHRCDEGRLLQLAALFHRDREDRHDLVTVDNIALGINGQAAVCIAVVREPQVSVMFQHSALQNIDMRRSAIFIDVERVGFVKNRDDIGAGGLIRHGRSRRRSTIRAIHHNPNAIQGRRHSPGEMEQIALQGVGGFLDNTTNSRTRRASLGQLQHGGFDLRLDRVVKFEATSREELDPVIRHGVVACGNNNAHVSAIIVGQECHSGGRNDAHAEDVDTLACHPRRQRGRQHLPRHTRVTPHNSDRPTATLPVGGQHLCRSGPQLHCQRRS